MGNQFNYIAEALGQYALDDIPYPDQDAAEINQLASEGTVVYVHRSESVLWHFALKRALAKKQLPLPTLTTTNHIKRLRPWFGIFKKKRPYTAQTLKKTIASGEALELHLKKPSSLLSSYRGDQSRHLQMLIELQRQTDKPIFLVGHFLAFRTRPPQFEPTTADLLFGSSAEPGFFRALSRILLSRKFAHWETCRPINLKEFIAEHAHLSDKSVAHRIRFSLLRAISRLEQTFHGPPQKSHTRLRLETLRDPDLQDFVTNLQKDTGVPTTRLEKKARRYYDEIAARFDIDVVRIFDKSLFLIWRRIYDELVWKQSDIEKLRRAAREGPLVIVPSHKSHVDYLVVSQILHREGLMPPYIAAGINLSFFPLGTLFRRGGAYFIRRSFKGDPLYPQVVKSYIKRLFKEGFTQEFFIEGSRSRSGKLLPPKLGLLSLMLETLQKGKQTNAVFVPASISYEKLMEAKSFKHELEGGKKKSENTADVIKSAKVLGKHYGRVFVTFDDPILLSEFLQGRENTPDVAKALAHRILFGINHCAVVTPTAIVATALLGAHRRTLTRRRLIIFAKGLIHFIRENSGPDIRFSDGLVDQTKAKVDHAIALLVADGLVLQDEAADTIYYRVNDKTSLNVDFYKNNILHHFVPDAILATAFLALTGGRGRVVRESALMQATQLLSEVFKFEFVYPAKHFAEIFHERVEYAKKHRVLVEANGLLHLSNQRVGQLQFGFAARLVSNFVDAYLVCAQKLRLEVPKCKDKSALTNKLREHIKGGFLSGAVESPESASKAVVENAVKYFVDQEILVFKDDKPELGPETKLEKLGQLVNLLQRAHFGLISG